MTTPCHTYSQTLVYISQNHAGIQQDLNTANRNIFGHFAVNIQQKNHIHKKLLHFVVLFASLLAETDHLQQEI